MYKGTKKTPARNRNKPSEKEVVITERCCVGEKKEWMGIISEFLSGKTSRLSR
jgi:hypothetical protein